MNTEVKNRLKRSTNSKVGPLKVPLGATYMAANKHRTNLQRGIPLFSNKLTPFKATYASKGTKV